MSSVTLLCNHGLKITIQEEDLKNIPVLYQRYLKKLGSGDKKIILAVNFDCDIIIYVINFYSGGNLNLDDDKMAKLAQFASIYNCEKLKNN